MIIRKWIESTNIKVEHQKYEIKQAYCWLISADKKIVLVSKDNIDWQFPWWKPEKNESLESTIIREIQEETGVDISDYTNYLKFFGYYWINDNNVNYLQVRLVLKLNNNSSSYVLKQNEIIDSKNPIIIAKFISLDEITEIIPWLHNSQELMSFLNSLEE